VVGSDYGGSGKGTSSANIGLLKYPDRDKEVPDEHGRWVGSLRHEAL
jgi:hypothetical protein